MVELGNIDSKNSLIRMLEQDFEIRPTFQRKGDMEEMCNLSSGLIEKGEKIGFERGEKSGFDKGEKSGFDKGEKSGFDKGEKSGFERGMRTTAQRAYERFGDYEIAASLADVSVVQVRKWLSKDDVLEDTDPSCP